MALSRRVEKFSALIRKEMSNLLMNGLKDHRVDSRMITITEVEVSGDLQHCKIFVSIFGDETKSDQAFLALEASVGYLRGELGRRLQMRRAPELVFRLDKGMEKGMSVLNLLGKLEARRKSKNQIIPEMDD
ncbi:MULTISPECIES: 30S ribosome-binding factor RbfA [Prochlorococcus]|uniref:30S ribosome-binding factor RbfA n=1 Tax=Prochlorococcus TaxID=1218 RepID=UPI000533AE72|nr:MULTISPECIES: 30S ribosome-binding factor RbfA [Prochlorococcus]KGG13263.1 Ribosome-binding factor A [Prochlorococcus sp. MIT 0601]